MSGKVSSTWLITGASSGIGKALALEALCTGCKVIGTTRDIGRAKTSFPEFSMKGGIWKELDPGHNDSFAQFSSCCREYDVDVLVNNAAYAFIGGVEDTRYGISQQAMLLLHETGLFSDVDIARARYESKWKSISTDHSVLSRHACQQ